MLTIRALGNVGALKQIRRCISFWNTKSETPKLEEPPPVDRVAEVELVEPSAKTIITKRTLNFVPPALPIRQAWVENMNTLEPNNMGIIDLHPSIFGTRPRLDLIFENYRWQKFYKYINWAYTPWQHEIKRSNRKPWPQKGTGRAQAGTRRCCIFLGGVKLHGPRGPKSHFYMLNFYKRVYGLCSTLSVKLSQGDLHVVDNLEIPTADPQYLLTLAEQRKWGPAVLFVDVCDLMPRNISIASNSIKHMNLMPVYGLNVHSMLKHDTLILTVDAVEKIEQKLLEHLHGSQRRSVHFKITDV